MLVKYVNFLASLGSIIISRKSSTPYIFYWYPGNSFRWYGLGFVPRLVLVRGKTTFKRLIS